MEALTRDSPFYPIAPQRTRRTRAGDTMDYPNQGSLLVMA